MKILTNVVEFPSEAKYRRLRKTNEKIQAVLAGEGASEALALAWFLPTTEDVLELKGGPEEAVAAAQQGLDYLATHPLGSAPAAAASVELPPPPPAAPLTVTPALALSRSLGHGGEVRAACALPGGGLATAGLDCVVRVWAGSGAHDPLSKAPVELRGHAGRDRRAAGGILALCHAAAAGGLASGGRDGQVLVWGEPAELAHGQAPAHALTGHGDASLANSQNVSCLCDAGGGTLASGGWDKTVRLWAGPGGAAGGGAADGGEAAVAAALAAAAAAAVGGTVSGVVLGHPVAVNALVSLPFGLVATGCGDGGVRLWDAASGTPEALGGGGCGGPVRAICAVPSYVTGGGGGDDDDGGGGGGDDGGCTGLAAVSNDGFLRVWSRGGCRAGALAFPASSSLRLAPFKLAAAVPTGEGGYLYAVAAAPNFGGGGGGGGGAIFTGGEDGVVTVWSYALVPLQRLAVPGPVHALAPLPHRATFNAAGGGPGSGPGSGPGPRGGGGGGVDLAVGCGDRFCHVLAPLGSGRECTDAGAAARFAAAVGPARSAAAFALSTALPPAVLTGADAEALARAPVASAAAPASAARASTFSGGTPWGAPPPPPRPLSSGPPLGPGFDFTFPVELGDGPALTISWNRGEDPDEVALRFCAAHSVSIDQRGDVADFVRHAERAVGGSVGGGGGGGGAGPVAGTPCSAGEAAASAWGTGAPPPPATPVPRGGGARPSAVGAPEPSPGAKAAMLDAVMALGVEEADALAALAHTGWRGVEVAVAVLFG